MNPSLHPAPATAFGMSLGLPRKSQWRSISPEHFTGETIQALGWRSGGRFLALQDDLASVAFWYQTHPAKPFPKLPSRDYLEVI